MAGLDEQLCGYVTQPAEAKVCHRRAIWHIEVVHHEGRKAFDRCHDHLLATLEYFENGQEPYGADKGYWRLSDITKIPT